MNKIVISKDGNRLNAAFLLELSQFKVGKNALINVSKTRQLVEAHSQVSIFKTMKAQEKKKIIIMACQPKWMSRMFLRVPIF